MALQYYDYDNINYFIYYVRVFIYIKDINKINRSNEEEQLGVEVLCAEDQENHSGK